MTKIDRIHVFGCSFTAGAELIDHLVFSPIGSMDDIDRLKFRSGSKFETDHRQYVSPEWLDDTGHPKYKEVALAQKAHAWPAILEKLASVSIVNHAIPGTSNDLMFLGLDQLIANDEIRPTDLVIIGLTSPNRVSYFNPYNNDRAETYHPFSDGQRKFSTRFTQEFGENIMTRKYMVWKFHEAKMKCNFYNMLLENRVVFLEAIHTSEHYYQVYSDASNDSEFIKTFRWFDDMYTNKLATSFNTFITDYRDENGDPNYEVVHGNFHPKIEIHQLVAESVYRELLTKYKFGN